MGGGRTGTLETASVGSRTAVRARDVSRRFGRVEALRGVSLEVPRGEIHALLGPNGAGKTTLLRVLTGLVTLDRGEVEVMGLGSRDLGRREAKRLFGLVPSGDRTFYLRLSGLENLVFFARLHGLRRADAVRRAWECLEAVDLTDAGRQRAGTYSHGMQKRLSVARGLLVDPPVLIVDEATHDLDPQGARKIQALVAEAAARGVTVLWATQRVDEIRGFADRVTLLGKGRVRFAGTVPQLMARSPSRRFLVRLGDRGLGSAAVLATAERALAGLGRITAGPNLDEEHFLIALGDEVVLGDALAAVTVAGIPVLACREERSEVEEAFLRLTEEEEAE